MIVSNAILGSRLIVCLAKSDRKTFALWWLSYYPISTKRVILLERLKLYHYSNIETPPLF